MGGGVDILDQLFSGGRGGSGIESLMPVSESLVNPQNRTPFTISLHHKPGIQPDRGLPEPLGDLLPRQWHGRGFDNTTYATARQRNDQNDQTEQEHSLAFYRNEGMRFKFRTFPSSLCSGYASDWF